MLIIMANDYRAYNSFVVEMFSCLLGDAKVSVSGNLHFYAFIRCRTFGSNCTPIRLQDQGISNRVWQACSGASVADLRGLDVVGEGVGVY